MKNKIAITAAILGSAILHAIPVATIAIIATGGETSRAIAVVCLAAGSLGLGYFHGLNKTKLNLW